MALRACFIGVDKHVDPRVPELTGARRDATALWALFNDTLPDVDGLLLADADATAESVRRALDQTLDDADPDDTVIVTFSGHGTRDHRLVTHDTVPEALAATTVPMADLAERFQRTRARAVLCVLDCCFSGGAPARVFEDTPSSRDPHDPLTALAGTGRVLLAAASVNQPAYELSGARHGVLTKALLDVLQAASGPVSLMAAADAVLDRVRAEAGRMGVEQTPVLLGYIEGGLTLPALRAGKHFFTAFPEARGARVGCSVADLAALGLPEPVLVEWLTAFPDGLNDLQLQAINEYRVLDGESLLVVAPTSSGKTFIGELAATRAVGEGRKAVFLLPYHALVNEKHDQFVALYGDQLGMRVIRCTGAYLDRTGDFVRGRYDLALLTYEMFLNLLVANSHVLNQIGLVVLDEGQFIADPGRGITVELLLTYILAARKRGVVPQLIVLSAVIGEVNGFDEWLGCRALVTHERPIPLTEGVLDRTGTFQFLDVDGKTKTTPLLPPHAIQIRRDKPSAQDVIVPLAKQLTAAEEKIIVFRNRRDSAQGCARYLAADLGLRPAEEAIARLPAQDLTTASADLRACLDGGTAFHTTNLLREERAVVEQVFRDPASGLRVLAATTTVAAGINTPAETVIIAEQEFLGEDGRPFSVAEYKNMAGRAGRLGYSRGGRAIILAETGFDRERLFRQYVAGAPEPIRSSFDPKDLETWLVRLLAQVRRVPAGEVVTLLGNTFGGYVATKRNPGWRPDMETRLGGLLDRMINLGLAEREGEHVQLTLLGRVCGNSALALESVLRLVELLQNGRTRDLTAERLMALVQAMREMDEGYTPMMKRGQSEARWPREAAARFGADAIACLQRYAAEFSDYWARCKRALVLSDWIAGTPLEAMERNYTINPYQSHMGHGDIRRIADLTRFHVRSAHQIASVVLLDEAPDEASIDRLLRRLEVGIPDSALDLLSLPVSLGRGEYLALHGAGATTPTAVSSLSDSALAKLVGPARAAELKRVLATTIM